MSPVWQWLQRIGVLENISPERQMEDDEGCDKWKEAVCFMNRDLWILRHLQLKCLLNLFFLL